MGRTVFHEDEFYRLLEAPGGPVYREVERVTTAAHFTIAALCPRRSGRTAASFEREVTSRQGRGVTGRVWSEDPVVGYLESGTGLFGPRGQVIRSRSGKKMGPIAPPYPPFLREQRGMRPQPFMRRGLEIASPWPVVESGRR